MSVYKYGATNICIADHIETLHLVRGITLKSGVRGEDARGHTRDTARHTVNFNHENFQLIAFNEGPLVYNSPTLLLGGAGGHGQMVMVTFSHLNGSFRMKSTSYFRKI